jgi:hypothetical protein
LVHVAANDELGPCFGERPKDGVASLQWPLSRGAPRGRREVMMECDEAQRRPGSVPEPSAGPRERRVTQCTALLAPRAHRVESYDDEVV